jgi:hypothetical protein
LTIAQSVLLLDRDALHHDGIVERAVRNYPRGVTVEANVRIPLTRRDKQWFWLCLLEGDPPPHPEAGFEWVEFRTRQSACFRYPNANLGRFDASLGHLVVGSGPTLTIDLDPHLPSSDWFQVGLQARPDGAVSEYLNQAYVGAAPLRLVDMESSPLRVVLIGSSWETEALVKNLRVWEGARYAAGAIER